uniref:Uncharacterized protein n=1 Tax=Trypanosoma congolense (strain IL3000) TaxID=1068625 RepID=G0ULA0_TRYCI|nr:conserved hypothetical protein [Trypanosoma congolense IL3000]
MRGCRLRYGMPLRTVSRGLVRPHLLPRPCHNDARIPVYYCTTRSMRGPQPTAGKLGMAPLQDEEQNDVSGDTWDDNTLLIGIARLLYQLLLQRSCVDEEGAGKSSEVGKLLPLQELFRELGPQLRCQLQNSSYLSLYRAIEHAPEWFVTDKCKSAVGLTAMGWKYFKAEDPKRQMETPVATASSGSPNEELEKIDAKPKGITTTCRNIVRIHGPLGCTPIDVTNPPLTMKDIEKCKLERVIYPLTLFFLPDAPGQTLFPTDDKPRELCSALRDLEALYVAKGFFPLSEVAAAFVHITPTFFVETRHVLNAMSPNVAYIFERHVPREHATDAFFRKYPTIFKLKLGKCQKAAVKLNLDFDFIRNYPGCGRADRHLRRYSQEYRPTVGGLLPRPVSPEEPTTGVRRTDVNIDVRIVETLVRNLPRVPTDPNIPPQLLEERRCKPFPLVDWINNFSEEDLQVLNSVPQARVLTLMTRYIRIFQLVCHGEDGNIFVESKYLDNMRNMGSGDPFGRSNASTACAASEGGKEAFEEVCDAISEGDEEPDGRGSDVVQSKEEVRRREANLADALRDDLIGLEGILSSVDCSSPECNKEEDVMEAEGKGRSIGALMREEEDERRIKEMMSDELGEGLEVHSDQPAGEDCRVHGMDKPGRRDAEDLPDTRPPCGNEEDDSGGSYIPSRYDIVYVRRLPKNIAPRSLSDYNEENSPEPELLRYIASFLNPPPSRNNGFKRSKGLEKSIFAQGPGTLHWRWVPIQRIYSSLSKEQKRLLRPYKGLVHFMRLHGEIFQLSSDFLHVIAHDPLGKIPPFIPTQTVFHSEERVLLPPTLDDDENSKASLIGDADRNKFKEILGASQVPTDRRQLLLLDPLNPLLDHEVLCEEVSLFMPDHPVSLHQLLSRLPPILKAALSLRHRNNFKTSRYLTVWADGNRTMLQKSELALPESLVLGEQVLSLEDAIECIREVVPDEGVGVNHLHRMLPSGAKRTLKDKFGSIEGALLGYPQYFFIEKHEGDRNNSVLFLVERLQEEQQN